MTQYSRNARTGVGIVALSGYALSDAVLENGIATLERQGCVVHNYYDPAEKFQRFGGTDAARVSQLHSAVRNPDVQLVLALRGGYGLSRILPAIDLNLLADSGKPIVGHSDVTALHLALLARTGAVSFAGPMVCDDFARDDVSSFTMEHFWGCVEHQSCTIAWQADANPALDANGILWGGNLSMLTHLIGTPYFPRIDGGILFFEDVNEHPYRVERMLLQLAHAGVLAQQKAVLLGDFSNYRLSEYDNGYDFDAMLACIRAQVGTPIVTGLPFGHMRDKATLAVGAQARLVSDGTDCQLSMNAYPVLPQAAVSSIL